MQLTTKILIFLIISYTLAIFSQQKNDAFSILDIRLEKIEDKVEILEIDLKGFESEQNKRYQSILNADKKLIRRIKTLNEEVKKSFKEIQNNDIAIEANKNKINEIRILYTSISSDLDYVTKQIDYLTEKVEMVQDDVSFLELSYDIMYNELGRTNEMIDENKVEIEKFPQYLRCEDCYPDFNIGISFNYFPSDLENVNNTSAIAFSFQKRINKRFGLGLSFQRSLIDVKTTESIGSGDMILDRWNFSIWSIDGSYLLSNFNKKYNLNVIAGFNYGRGSQNDFYNQQNIARGESENFNSFGAKFGLELSYLNSINKNPIELVFGFDNYATFQNIRIDQGVGEQTNIGSYLLAFRFGVRYNFWFSE